MMGYIKRDIEDTIKKFLKIPQAIAILGPRRSGKTTLIQHLQKELPGSLYLTFENQQVLNLFETDIDSFVDLYVKKYDYIFLDEFHYSGRGGKHLKYIYDSFPGKKIIISGSSALDITVKAVKFLVGRIISFELFPFSFKEFLRARDEEMISVFGKRELPPESPLYIRLFKLWEEYLVFGGYPEVVLQDDKEVKIKILEGIYNTYLLREVRDIIGITDDFKYTRLLRALALQIGNLINYGELSRISGYDHKTLKSRLNVLQKTYILAFLFPFFRNKRTEIVKNPKVYFFDSGLRNFIIGNFQQLDLRIDKGSLCENYIFSLFNRWGIKNYYWRTKSKAEIDFIIEKRENLSPVEVKCAEYLPKIPRSFHTFGQKYSFKEGAIFSLAPEIRELKLNNSRVFFLPIYTLELRPDLFLRD